MIYPPDLLDFLQGLPDAPWTGTVWRHVLGDRPVITPNTRGARWNPPDVSALYTSLERDTAIAEGSHTLSLQNPPPRVKRRIVQLRVALASVIDLRDRQLLARAGLGSEQLTSNDHSACRLVGGAVAWLANDGLIVPSARASGGNLVIFLIGPSTELEVVSDEVLTGDSANQVAGSDSVV